MDRAKPIVNAIVQQESKARWSCHREVNRKHSEAVRENESDSFEDENLNRIWESILSNSEIEQLGPGVGQLLVDHAKAILAMKRCFNPLLECLDYWLTGIFFIRAASRVREKFTADLIQAEVDIRLRHPLLSLVKPWMDRQLIDVKVRPVDYCVSSDNRPTFVSPRRSLPTSTSGSVTRRPSTRVVANRSTPSSTSCRAISPSSET